MLTLEQIKELAEMVARLELGGVEVERSGFRVRIDGRRPAPVAAAAPPAAAPATVSPPAAAPAPAAGDGEDGDELPEGVEIQPSPTIGTFYRAPSPDAAPFVEVGDRVEVGQVLCIVEAMKLMNEIESDLAGTVVEVYPDNAEPVQHGQPLFAIRTAD